MGHSPNKKIKKKKKLIRKWNFPNPFQNTLTLEILESKA